jgi:hypothetical protein
VKKKNGKKRGGVHASPRQRVAQGDGHGDCDAPLLRVGNPFAGRIPANHNKTVYIRQKFGRGVSDDALPGAVVMKGNEVP